MIDPHILRRALTAGAFRAVVLVAWFSAVAPVAWASGTLILVDSSSTTPYVRNGTLQQTVDRVRAACDGSVEVSAAHRLALPEAVARYDQVWLLTGTVDSGESASAARFYETLRSGRVRHVEMFAMVRPNGEKGPLVYAISSARTTDAVVRAQTSRFAERHYLWYIRVLLKPLTPSRLLAEYRDPAARIKMGTEFNFATTITFPFLQVPPASIGTKGVTVPLLGDDCLVLEKRLTEVRPDATRPGTYAIGMDLGIVRLRRTAGCVWRTLLVRSAEYAALPPQLILAARRTDWRFSQAFLDQFGARNQEEADATGKILGLEHVPAALMPDSVEIPFDLPIPLHVDYAGVSTTAMLVVGALAIGLSLITIRRFPRARSATRVVRVHLWPKRTDVCFILSVLILGVALARFGREVVLGPTIRGDFYQTFPGEYAVDLNPSLWDSPDRSDSRLYQKYTYWYGPTQYLTLFPLVFLNSYQRINDLLRVLYVFVIAASVVVMWKTISFREPETKTRALPWMLAATLMFFPLIVAYSHREFEVVLFAMISGVIFLRVHERHTVAGARLGYATWFKFWPIVLTALFMSPKRVKALAGFLLFSAATLLAAHVVFGFQHFVNNGFFTSFLQGSVVQPMVADDFCVDLADFAEVRRLRYDTNRENPSLRRGLCVVSQYAPVVPARVVFLAMSGAVACLWLYGFRRSLLRRRADEQEGKWPALFEASLLVTVATTWVYSNYYYWIMLLWPINCLIFKYANTKVSRRPLKVGLLAVSYVLLSAFVVPRSVFEGFGIDIMRVYMGYGIYLCGLLGLLTLLCVEYYECARGDRLMRIATHAPAAQVVSAASRANDSVATGTPRNAIARQ